MPDRLEGFVLVPREEFTEYVRNTEKLSILFDVVDHDDNEFGMLGTDTTTAVKTILGIETKEKTD